MLSLSVCAVTGVILALVLKSTGSSMGTFVSVVLCVGTAMLVFNGLISVYTRINMFTAGINQEYIKLIVKVIGISYVQKYHQIYVKKMDLQHLRQLWKYTPGFLLRVYAYRL